MQGVVFFFTEQPFARLKFGLLLKRRRGCVWGRVDRDHCYTLGEFLFIIHLALMWSAAAQCFLQSFLLNSRS